MELDIVWIYIVFILLMIAFSAFFSSSETAFSSLNRIRIKRAAEKGDKAARRVLRIAERYDKMLSTILIGNNIVNIACASVGTVLFTIFFGAAGAGISTIVITIIVLIFGEVLPKSIAKENAEKAATLFSAPIRFLMALFTPLSQLLVLLTNAITKAFRRDTSEPTVTEQELKYIVEEIESEGVLEEQESELVRSALDFDEVTVDRILTPRVDLVSADITDDIESVKIMFLTERFSRVPVYEGTVDNIIGILYEKDFFKSYITDPDNMDLRALICEPVFVPPQKKISELLKELQAIKSHIAVVTDQYGGTLGIVTLEDILEQLVGEIWDEDDDIVEDIVPIGNDTYIVNPDMDVYDLFEELNLDYNAFVTDSTSVGGWMLDQIEKIPNKNDTLIFKDISVTVLEIEEKRIKSLQIKVNRSKTEDE